MTEELTGIYAIVSSESGKVYVGSTATSFKKRWTEHRAGLRGNYHHNPHLQAAWARYGEGAFEFVICECVDDLDRLIEREQYWLDQFRVMYEVYNLGVVAACPTLGVTFSEEVRGRMSRAQMGNKSRLGIPHTEETKRKIGAANSGARSPNYGKHLPRATREKIGRASRGRTHSKETRDKISKALGKRYPSFIHRGTGEIILAGINLSALCRERGLNRGGMCCVANGKWPHHRGWMLVQEHET